MDLGEWNSDFDSSFLNCWDEGGDTNSTRGGGGDNKDKQGRNRSVASSRSSPRDDPSMWDGSLTQWSQISNLDYEAATSEKSKGSEPERVSNDGSSQQMTVPAAAQHISNSSSQGVMTSNGPPSVSTAATAPSSLNAAHISATTSVASVAALRDTASSTTSVEATNNNNNNPSTTSGSGLHRGAIQSTATCPPHGNGNGTNQPIYQQMHTLAAALPQLALHAPQNGTFNFYGGLAAGMDTASLATLAASLQGHSGNTNLTPQTTQHLSSLAANFILAQGNNSTTPTQQVHGHNSTTTQQNLPQHQQGASATSTTASAPRQSQQVPTLQQAAAAQQPTATAVSVAGSSSVGGGSSSSSSNQQTSRKQSRAAHSRATTATRQQHQQQGSTSTTVPPFYLFDAPIELRSNFVQNQRRLGIPVEEDCNSYHYGETVKGFHPQNLLDAKHPPAAAAAPPAPVQLVDARHGNSRQQMAGRVKNEREQKRAQKITELIEQLRLNMENGGWKVEMRSKFHTLSSCASYVKHMIKTLKEKEEKTKKLKEELEVKQQMIAEDKSVQESRSDPESVTSSLTSSTGGSHSHKAEDSRKRKADRDETTSTSNKKHCDGNSRNVSSYGTCEDSSGDDRGSGRSRGAFNDVSDITDSNRGSSSNSSGSGGSDDGPTVTRDAAEDEQNSAGSISSDAAVRSERSSHNTHGKRQHHHHKDVVFTDKKSPEKRKSDEINSMNSNFELDYEEVFDKSNIPQIIAATSGKVVAWNEVFGKATGLRKSEMERMTIFSLVQPDKLANFFQIVAAALKPEEEHSQSATSDGVADSNIDSSTKLSDDDKSNGKGEESKATEEEANDVAKGETASKPAEESSTPNFTRNQDYAAITLPCIDFPGMKKLRERSDETLDPKPLHVTVTLMDDDDPKKRCFHCVFTNNKGTDGALGLITPELLEALFTVPDSKKSKSHHRHHHHHKSKRQRTRDKKPPRDEERLDGNKIDKIIPIPTKTANKVAEEQRHAQTGGPLTVGNDKMNDSGGDASQYAKKEETQSPSQPSSKDLK